MKPLPSVEMILSYFDFDRVNGRLLHRIMVPRRTVV